jgi:arylsulfatase A
VHGASIATVNLRYTTNALEFLEQQVAAQSKFFLYLAFGHVHTPQFAGKAQFGKSKRGIFGDSMSEVDTAVGAVLEAVKGTNTLTILSSVSPKRLVVESPWSRLPSECQRL